MRNNQIYKTIARVFYEIFIFFIAVSFITTCSIMIFFDGLNLPIEVIQKNALRTFINVIIIAILIWSADFIRRKLTVERYVTNINNGLSRIVKGEYNFEIEKSNSIFSEKQFNLIIESINIMAKELSSVETFRNDFIANVSHEFKTPISIIQNYSTLISDRNISKDEQVEYSEKIIETTNKLGNLVTNILKLNKLENQNIFAKNEKINLSEQLYNSILVFENEIENKNINLETNIDDDIYILSDLELLEIVLNNLFSNALKFTESGGKISVRAKEKNDKIYVEIEDNGIGMNSETGKHVFEKFYQGDTSHANIGNGLGLSLVLRIVYILNGEVNVKSELGDGSVFTIVLNRA